MRLLIFILAIIPALSFSQKKEEYYLAENNKGRVALSFGVNRSSFDLGNFSVLGDNKNFTLHDYEGNDGFKGINFSANNIKLEYFFHNRLSAAISYSNMNYVGFNNRLIQISGQIDTGNYKGQYLEREDVIRTTPDLITNNTQISTISLSVFAHDDFMVFADELIVWSYYFGVGGGIVTSKSDISILNQESYSSSNGMNGFNFQSNFGTRLNIGPAFIDFGGKVGTVRMNNIALDENGTIAKQSFIFASGIASIGVSYNF